MGRPVYHSIKYSSALTNRAVFAGVYTSDLVVVSFVAFIITLILEGHSIGVIYAVIGAVCIPLYLFLLAKNRLFPRGWFLFKIREMLGGRQEFIIAGKKESVWDF